MLAGSLLAAMVPLAPGQDPAAEREVKEHASNVAKIATGFVNFAGSEDNAVALVESLHEGAAVMLMYAPPGEGYTPAMMPIEPPTGPMEWSDVRMALMLARDALLGLGISRPTSSQLHAVLLGGEVESKNGRLVGLRGVLQMRAEGLTWTRIASERFQRPAVARIE
ncbi:MAG: hypothetical protein ABIQ50_15020 [Usitatibacter sp.]